jgi:uncharacterized membrane protein
VLKGRSRSKKVALSSAAYAVADAAPSAEAVVERTEIEAALAEILVALSIVERQALLDGLTGVTWRKRRQRALSRLKLLWSAEHE